MKNERKVTYCEHSSTRSFEEVITAFEAATGSIEREDFDKIARPYKTFDEFEARFRAEQGSSGFMRFSQLDHGAWLTLTNRPTRAILYTLGNPLIALTMLRHALDAALYVPVRLLIAEHPETGTVRVTYDLPSTLMAHFGNAEMMAAAQKLDAKLIALGVAISGAEL